MVLLLLFVQDAAVAGELLFELNGMGRNATARLPPDTLGVELVTQRAGACRFGRTWGYDENTLQVWANGCWGTFVVFTPDAPPPPGPLPPSQYHPRQGPPPPSHPGVADGPRGHLYPWGNGREGAIRGPGGLCLDMRGDRVVPGTEAILYRCHGRDNQHFVWSPRGELVVGGLCLDVAGGGNANGARVVAAPCGGGRHQQWFLNGSQIQSRRSGKCLDVAGGSSRSGTPVIVFDCHGGKNQRWSL
jgi:hypothetical protein